MNHRGAMDFARLQFGDDEALARGVAKRWLEQLATRSVQKRYAVALSGGRIARRFFSEIVSQWPSRTLLEQVEFFWADERCVPPTDPESNFAVAQQTLFGPLEIGPEQIHRVHGEMDPSRAAAEAEAEILRLLPADEKGRPVLDLVFLGMGEDGHIASLFPHELEEAGLSEKVYRAVIGPKPPPARITINYPALSAARQVWVLASGPGKEPALQASITEPFRTPLGRLLRMRQSTTIFTDLKTPA